MHNLTQGLSTPRQGMGVEVEDKIGGPFSLLGHQHGDTGHALPVFLCLPGSEKAMPGCWEDKSRVTAAARMVLKEREGKAALFSTRKVMSLLPSPDLRGAQITMQSEENIYMYVK